MHTGLCRANWRPLKILMMRCMGCSYAQSALAVNEFLAPRWQIVRPLLRIRMHC